jgi:hypothetical protein
MAIGVVEDKSVGVKTGLASLVLDIARSENNSNHSLHKTGSTSVVLTFISQNYFALLKSGFNNGNTGMLLDGMFSFLFVR